MFSLPHPRFVLRLFFLSLYSLSEHLYRWKCLVKEKSGELDSCIFPLSEKGREILVVLVNIM